MNQKQQGGARLMKIGQNSVYAANAVTRLDHETGFGLD